MARRFRILVVVWIVLYVWLFSLPSSAYKQPPDVREALAYSGRGAILLPTDTVAYLILGAFLATAIGLLAWQTWARNLLLVLLVVLVVLRGLRGIAVAVPFSAVLGMIFTLLTGVIVVLMYTEPLASRFAETGNDQGSGQAAGTGDEEVIAVCETDRAAEVPAISALLASAGVRFTTSDEELEEQLEAGETGAVRQVVGPVRFLVRAEDANAARAVLSVFRLSGTRS
jgi:amino acid transporter